MAIRIETLGVFPQMFEPIMSLSIMGRARKAGYLEFAAHDLRDAALVCALKRRVSRKNFHPRVGIR